MFIQNVIIKLSTGQDGGLPYLDLREQGSVKITIQSTAYKAEKTEYKDISTECKKEIITECKDKCTGNKDICTKCKDKSTE